MPEGFGYKTAWFAVASDDQWEAARALGLRDVEEIGWTEGLELAYRQNGFAFVSPPIGGWVLVVGFCFADLASHDVRFVDWLARASTELETEVQFFCTHRVVELHAWGRAREGTTERAYAYVGESGEVLVNHGEPTPAELKQAITFGDETPFESDDYRPPNEGDVMDVAGAWSVDPTTLDERSDVPDGPGLWGAIYVPPSASRPGRATKRPWWRFW